MNNASANDTQIKALLELANKSGAHVEAIGSDEELVIYTGWYWNEDLNSYQLIPG